MAKRHKDEIILASWYVDAVTWRTFARAVRAHDAQAGQEPRSCLKFKEEPPTMSGAEVVVRDDAVFIGPHAMTTGYLSEATLRDEWLEILLEPSDGGPCIVPVPVSAAARPEAARVTEHLLRIAAEHAQKATEAARRDAEARALPTVNNRALNIVERHFVLILLGFFFVLLPAVVAGIYFASRWLGFQDKWGEQ
jgi:hypothetical protein